MNLYGYLQILLYLALLTALTKPVGLYLEKVYAGEKTLLDFVCRPLERLFYKLARVDAAREMNWKEYGAAILAFSLVSSLALYLIQRLQNHLPFNPQKFAAVPPALSFNTAVSFAALRTECTEAECIAALG